MRGTVYDGRSARGWPVAVEPDEAGITLVFDDGGTESLIPSSLKRGAAQPGRTVFHRRDNPDWRLVLDTAQPPDWIGYGGQGRRINGRRLAIYGSALSVLVAVGISVFVFGGRLLDLGAQALPHRMMVPIGRAIVSAVGEDRQCRSSGGQAALDRLTERLKPLGGFVEPVSVSVVDVSTINAFAAPGGQIVILRGLLDKAEGPDEIAGVLAHEVTHVQLRHPAKMLLRSAGLSLIIQSLGGNVGQLAGFAAMRTGSRDAERAADAGALAILRHSQISPAGIETFFARMERERKDRKPADTMDAAIRQFSNFASSHPGGDERLAAIRQAEGENWPERPAMTDADWAALRRICDDGPTDEPGND